VQQAELRGARDPSRGPVRGDPTYRRGGRGAARTPRTRRWLFRRRSLPGSDAVNHRPASVEPTAHTVHRHPRVRPSSSAPRRRRRPSHLAALQADASRRAEERVADAFAAAVLIPDGAVDEVLNGSAPTAQHLVDLFHRSDVAGSREACCVRIAQRMTGNGYVILAEGNRLRFCAVVGSAYAIRRGTEQPGVGLLRIATEQGTSTDPNTKLQFPDGRFTGEYAGHSVADGLYTFAVLTDSSTPPWGGWIAPRRSEGEAPEIFCLECDEVTEAWQRCDTNSAHRVCSVCGWCECHTPRVRVAERRCDVCTVLKRVDLFPDGGSTCRDCL
jgi:hypothetical protein